MYIHTRLNNSKLKHSSDCYMDNIAKYENLLVLPQNLMDIGTLKIRKFYLNSVEFF